MYPVESNGITDLLRKLGVGNFGEIQIFERPKANDPSHMNSEMNVGNPKIVGIFWRPQNNSRKTDLDANLKDNVVNNGFSNHKKLAKAPRIPMGIYYSKPIGDLMECSHAIKVRSSNLTDIACYGVVATNTNIGLLHENTLEVENSSTNPKIARAKPLKFLKILGEFAWSMS